MVHKKSTYKLTYRNYAPHVRQSVWQENNDIRQRRIEEERSHHSIEESDSDCVCDECEEEEHTQALPPRGRGVARLLAPRHTLTQAQEQGREQAGVPSQVAGPAPAVPRLRFSPDHSPPRICDHPRTPDSTDEEGGGEDGDALPPQTHGGGSAPDLHETHILAHPREVSVGSRNRARSSSIQRGVMRQGGHAREYDLIPAEKEEVDGGRPKRVASAGARIAKSHQLPLTAKLSRTTRRNYHDRCNSAYVAYGTGSSVRRIGDKTSFNIHLNKDQVQPTALQASTHRNKEIENLIKKQRNLTIDDWRGEKESGGPVNHSSLFADGRQQIFSSRKHPRKHNRRPASRVEVFSNFCNHCGGRTSENKEATRETYAW